MKDDETNTDALSLAELRKTLARRRQTGSCNISRGDEGETAGVSLFVATSRERVFSFIFFNLCKKAARHTSSQPVARRLP